MNLSQDVKQSIEHIAEETLTQFKSVAEEAKKSLRESNIEGTAVLANVNTLTYGRTIQNLRAISQENCESYHKLMYEPAIARVVVADAEDKQRTYYICRTTPILGMASYRSPVGRLASLPVGETLALPNGTVEVIEQARLNPSFNDNVWDSRHTVIVNEKYGPITIESLRSLLKMEIGLDLDKDLLERLLAEESQTANIINGMRRKVITKMGLRDQPVLDQYQDEIFRLPLNKRLLILGPPGTGKTTTLIRRLGQKLDKEFLDENERRIVERVSSAAYGTSHEQSWLMFTPTELLKQYLKEAFAREGVPASDQRIRTWSDYRRELARNTLGVLKTASGGGSFIIKDFVENLATDALDKHRDWFFEFDKWQRSAFFDDAHASALELSKNNVREIADLGQRLLSIVQRARGGSLASAFMALNTEVAIIRTMVDGMKEVTDNKILSALNLQLNRNRTFIDELAKFIDGFQLSPESDNDEIDDQDSEEEDANSLKTVRTAAVSAYKKAVRAQSLAHVSKRIIGKNSRNGKIIEWLGERTLAESERADIGDNLLVQSSARLFVNPVKKYISGIPKRYRAFRRQCHTAGKWYRSEGSNQSELHPLELDVVLLAILKSAGELLGSSDIAQNIDDPVWSSLKSIHDLYQNQILVDEVTDFSPVQIACMAALSNPRIRSFFACGDFNQRLTTWGSRSIEDMKWVFPEIEVNEISVTYRQSRQLNELSKAIISAEDGIDRSATLPKDVDNDGVAPVLAESMPDFNDIVDWLAQRICEIERFVRQLPSIAIFVDREEEVQPIAEALHKVLAGANIQVVACPKGQVMGQGNDVRVFDVQHIKGLEFEAVFFIGIDRLATLHPDLFDKYLYVGTTRAATYLGITCDNVLPTAISELRQMFVSDWNTP